MLRPEPHPANLVPRPDHPRFVLNGGPVAISGATDTLLARFTTHPALWTRIDRFTFGMFNADYRNRWSLLNAGAATIDRCLLLGSPALAYDCPVYLDLAPGSNPELWIFLQTAYSTLCYELSGWHYDPRLL